MNCDIHNVISLTSSVKKVTTDYNDRPVREPYFVHNMVVTTLDHNGTPREESLTFYSNNNDECQVTLFPPMEQ